MPPERALSVCQESALTRCHAAPLLPKWSRQAAGMRRRHCMPAVTVAGVTDNRSVFEKNECHLPLVRWLMIATAAAAAAAAPIV